MTTIGITIEYPHLERDDVLAAIDYAAKTTKHEELIFPVETEKLKAVTT